MPDPGCRLWTVRLDSASALGAAASPHEQERAAQFLRPEDRDRSLIAAGLLRLAVAHVLGTDPADVEVRRDCRCGRPHGRPTLPGTGWHASVSHAGDLVAVALTDVAEVGVDVEQVRDVDVVGMSRHVLAPDEAVPEDRAAFFALWTRKEAVVKATGDGIGAMARVHLVVADGHAEVARYDGRDGLPARLVDLDTTAGYAGALAVLTDGAVEIVHEDAAAFSASEGRGP
jgi:4'-phosphopantetheinyl transferase